MEKDIETINGKNALLTGRLGSLGLAQASKLSTRGVNVTILDKKSVAEGKIQTSNFNRNVSYLKCDLNNLNKAQFIVENLSKELGGFDI